jgi:hypothetical protein
VNAIESVSQKAACHAAKNEPITIGSAYYFLSSGTKNCGISLMLHDQ